MKLLVVAVLVSSLCGLCLCKSTGGVVDPSEEGDMSTGVMMKKRLGMDIEDGGRSMDEEEVEDRSMKSSESGPPVLEKLGRRMESEELEIEVDLEREEEEEERAEEEMEEGREGRNVEEKVKSGMTKPIVVKLKEKLVMVEGKEMVGSMEDMEEEEEFKMKVAKTGSGERTGRNMKEGDMMKVMGEDGKAEIVMVVEKLSPMESGESSEEIKKTMMGRDASKVSEDSFEEETPSYTTKQVVYIEVPEHLKATERDLANIFPFENVWKHIEDLPADQLKDFSGLCYSWHHNKLYQVGDAWSLPAPFCRISTCQLDSNGRVYEKVYHCGSEPEPSGEDQRCYVDSVRSKPEEPFPHCCPIYACSSGDHHHFHADDPYRQF